MALGGFVVAMALGALVTNILGMTDEAIDRVAPVIMFGGAVDLTRFAGQGWCVDHAARAAVSWWMVASYSAGLR
jgi:hypothetical protein